MQLALKGEIYAVAGRLKTLARSKQRQQQQQKCTPLLFQIEDVPTMQKKDPGEEADQNIPGLLRIQLRGSGSQPAPE